MASYESSMAMMPSGVNGLLIFSAASRYSARLSLEQRDRIWILLTHRTDHCDSIRCPWHVQNGEQYIERFCIDKINCLRNIYGCCYLKLMVFQHRLYRGTLRLAIILLTDSCLKFSNSACSHFFFPSRKLEDFSPF